MTTTTQRNLLGIAILVLITIAMSLTMCDGCNKCKVVERPSDQINKLIENKTQKAEKIQIRIDTVEIVRTFIKYKYHTIYDTLIRQAPDTCETYLIALDKACAAKDSINEVQLLNYSNLAGEYSDIIGLQKAKIEIDSVYIVDLNKKIDSEIKHGKRNLWRGRVQGGGVGLVFGYLMGKVF